MIGNVVGYFDCRDKFRFVFLFVGSVVCFNVKGFVEIEGVGFWI